MTKVIVFDVIETLLDLTPLDPLFHRFYGDESIRQLWFGQMIEIAMTMTITGQYDDFSRVAGAALEMTAERCGKEVAEAERSEILRTIKSLPLHDDVRAGLTSLRERGWRLAALTNSTAEVADAQLESAGVATLFEAILSVDAWRRYKPAREAYDNAAKSLGVNTGEILMVAAHSWDISGALRAGCRGAFVRRPGKSMNPLGPQPDLIVEDLRELARLDLRWSGQS